jgi:glycosyltransferase involved in cell wall biosynthesis
MSVGGIWGEPIELCVRAVLSDQSRCAIGSLRVRTSAAGDATPLVSVVIPCYGHAHFLPEAITSVLSQTHANVEVVVVDDGSQDNVVAVVAQYPGVRLVRQENRGLAAARNTGIRESNGEFLVFLDADDMLTSTAVEAGLDCFDRHPDCQLVMGRFRSVDWDRQLQWWSPRELPASVDHYASLLSGDYAGPPAICMYRRFALETLGGFDEAVPAAADYDLSLRVARNYPIEFHDSEVLDYRKGSYNMSNDGRLMFDNVMRVARRHRRHARAREDLRVAYTTGVEYWRELYASRALEQIEAAIVDHDLRGSLAGAMSLVRHDPPRLPAVVARVRRYNRLLRAKTQTTK